MRQAISWTLVCFAAALGGPPASAAFTVDPGGDFLPTFTGVRNGDLDVLSADVTFDGTTFRLTATLAAPVGTTPSAVYVFGFDRGQGTERFVTGTPSIGAGVRFDSVVTLLPNLTGTVNTLPGTAALAAGSVTVSGATISAAVPASLLPSRGFAPGDYTWNLWPRDSGLTGNAAVSDFAPNASNAAVTSTPAPPAALAMAAGLGLLGLARRRRG